MGLLRNGSKNRRVDISAPFNFEHRVHAEVDNITGEIHGLPRQWKSVLHQNSRDRLYKRGPLIVPDSSLIKINGNNRAQSALNHTSSFSSNFSPSHLQKNEVIAHRHLLNGHFSSPSTDSTLIISNPNPTCSSPLINQKPRAFYTPSDVKNSLTLMVDPSDPRNDLCNIKLLGQGSTGTVSQAYMSSRRKNVAVKRMNIKCQQRPELLLNEVTVMSKCNHKHVVSMISAHLVEDELWICMELAMGGSLTSFISQKRLTEETIATITIQSLDALQYLHSNGIIHRDLKSDSILFSKDKLVKLSDFGFAAILTEQEPKRKSLLGTPYWLAPEVAKREFYNSTIDIWSFGITIIEMVCGEPPYYDDEPATAIEHIKTRSSPKIPAEFQISPQLEDLLFHMLHLTPSERWSASQLIRHDFLKKALTNPSDIQL